MSQFAVGLIKMFWWKKVLKILWESTPHILIAAVLIIYRPDLTGLILFWAIVYPDSIILVYQIFYRLNFFRVEGLSIMLHLSLIPLSIFFAGEQQIVLAVAVSSHLLIDILEIIIDPPWEKGRYFIFKKWLDTVFALVAVIITSPLMLIIAVSIKIDSRGPIFYKQLRMTIQGRAFNLLKFRTMIPFARKKQIKDDIPKEKLITRVGKVWRETHLDELPQLLQVFMGPMSFIGPRPLPYSQEMKRLHLVPHWEERLKVRGGLTSLTRLVNILSPRPRQKLIDALPKDPEVDLLKDRTQCAFDRYYVRRLSFSLDFLIMCYTIGLLWQRIWLVVRFHRYDEFTRMNQKPYLVEYRH